MKDWLLGSSAVVGAVAFPSLLGVFQHAVFKPLKLSSYLKSSSIFGFVSVTLASYGASWAALQVIHTLSEKEPAPASFGRSLTEPELLLSTVGGVMMFRALGGKFKAVLPSNLMFPGAYCKEWLPCLKESDVTAKERALVRSMGKKYGCHTCGRKRFVEFIADHQPPWKVVGKNKIEPELWDPFLQRLYPQCSKCSSLQGGLLGNVKNPSRVRKSFVTHAGTLRLHHAFLPIPLLVFCTKKYFVSHQNGGTSAVGAASGDQLDMSTKSQGDKKQVDKENGEEDGRKVEMRQTGLLDSDWWSGFPLLIVWQRVIGFLESFSSRVDAFHLTLWTFSIIAALGTI